MTTSLYWILVAPTGDAVVCRITIGCEDTNEEY